MSKARRRDERIDSSKKTLSISFVSSKKLDGKVQMINLEKNGSFVPSLRLVYDDISMTRICTGCVALV